MTLEHKSIAASNVTVVDESAGILSAIISVTGLVDNVKDRILPGAYTKSLKVRTPKGVWSHNWAIPVSKALEMKELMPGDPDLPTTLADGSPWPAQAGAVKALIQFNLNTTAGRDAYENAKFYDDQQEWSIGYNVPAGTATKTGDVRELPEVDLFEFSQVLFGAMSNARTVKEAAREELLQIKNLLGDDFALELKDMGVHAEEVSGDGLPDDDDDDNSVDEDAWDELDDDGEEKAFTVNAEGIDMLTKGRDAINAILTLLTPVEAERTLLDVMADLSTKTLEPQQVPPMQRLYGTVAALDMAVDDHDESGMQNYAVKSMQQISDLITASDDDDLIEELKALAVSVVDAVSDEVGDAYADDEENYQDELDLTDDELNDVLTQEDEDEEDEADNQPKMMTVEELKDLRASFTLSD